MTTEVAKFDPTTYVDKVRDKIKQSLIYYLYIVTEW